jgi:hypothetical protein
MGREAGSRKFDPSVAFGPQQITRYPNGTPPEALEHRYRLFAVRNGKRLPITRAMRIFSSVHRKAVAKYEKELKIQFDRFNIPKEHEKYALSLYHNNPDFQKACTILNLTTKKQRDAIGYPWANYIAADEAGYNHMGDSGGAGGKVVIAPRHFFETQALSVSDLPIQSISVSSVLKTTDGKYAIGLRGGHRFPNVYHVFASALLLTEGIKDGTQSISDFNLQNVLLPETGVGAKEIERVTLLSRIGDWSGKDPMYNFLVELKITMGALNALFAKHRKNSKYAQRSKYQFLVPIDANSFAISQFINNYYRGMLKNDKGRKDGERAIIFPGAVTLLSLTGLSIETLQGMHKDDKLH